MPFEKWTAMSPENFSMAKVFQKLTRFFTRRRPPRPSSPTGQREIKAMELVFGNPMLLQKILQYLEGKTLLNSRRVSKLWLTLTDEILEDGLYRNHFEISFQYSNRHQLYFLSGHQVKWWQRKMSNYNVDHHPLEEKMDDDDEEESGEEKTLENFGKLLETSAMQNYIGKFPSFTSIRFVGGQFWNKIPQNFFTQHGTRIKSLTLDLANCCSWSNHNNNYEECAQLLKIVAKLFKTQLTTLHTLYLQSFPSVWTKNNAYYGKLFAKSLSKNENVQLPRLQCLQIGPNLVFSNAKAFGLIHEIFEAAVNLKRIIFRTWNFTTGGSFHSLDFMRKCVDFSTSPGRHDLVLGVSYFCLDPFMLQVDLLEQFAECCNLKISLLYLCEANIIQHPEMGRRAQVALIKIMERNKSWLRELICTRSELIVLTQLQLPKLPSVLFLSVGIGRFQRRMTDEQGRVGGGGGDMEMVTQKWTKVFDIFPYLVNLHIQMNTVELLGYWSSGSVICKWRSHQNIPWDGIVYTKDEERSKFIHTGN